MQDGDKPVKLLLDGGLDLEVTTPPRVLKLTLNPWGPDHGGSSGRSG